MSNLGRKFSEEHKNKISKSLIERGPWWVERGLPNPFKGKHHTEEFKQKLSVIRKGKKLSEEHKRKIGLGQKGKKRSEETKRKISEGNQKHQYSEERIKKAKEQCLMMAKNNIGKKHSDGVKRKISESNIGKHDVTMDKNPNWRGGVSFEPYCNIWGDQEYKQSILERDNYQCQNPGCSKKSQRIGIHHIDYGKKNCHPWNLITLCYVCNSKANFNREYWKMMYRKIMKGKIC